MPFLLLPGRGGGFVIPSGKPYVCCIKIKKKGMKQTLLCMIFLFSLPLYPAGGSGDRLPSYGNYIRRYGDLAVRQQAKYGIPASIILAQGLLESGAGQSELVRKSNNHFGIKCHSEWKGEKIYRNDDLKHECFRRYKNVEESYEDHSVFLSQRSRYADLFRLDRTNYKGWAKGLQKAGYATNPAYANSLIKIIEDYQLYLYDRGKTPGAGEVAKEDKKKEKAGRKDAKTFAVKRSVLETGGLRYVYAGQDDSFERIAEDTGLPADELRRYNEVPDHFPLQKGDMVYLEKKKRRAGKPSYDHVVQIGESMHSISQKYGLQVKRLYKINRKKEDYIPVEGDVLKLR
jgi:LysM repeat protein